MSADPADPAPPRHVRRPRYPGRNPRTFAQKYKELNPEKYAGEVEKVLAAGKTPAGMHVPIMLAEVIEFARPEAGAIVVDCTLGGGGHAKALLDRIQPGGRLIGLDVDADELARTEARLRASGFDTSVFTAHHGTFAGVAQAVSAAGASTADVLVADLGVSSMQLDNPDRGFSYKGVGPLDMRMDRSRGRPAFDLIASLSESELGRMLDEHADEPHAAIIARLLKSEPLATTQAAERVVRLGLGRALPKLGKADVKMSIRRTFQALRIAVNDELSALDALLRALPHVLAPGGRAVVLTFHSGEDRRVKQAFRSGERSGIYAEVARDVVRASMAETRANRRASSAKLRWAVRA
jgi:16S rRNA (cytosine1402-N4)-methyltransferase